MRDSTAACTTVGLDVRRLKLAVFCLSASLGAIAGAFVAMQRGTPTAPDFGMFPGIAMVMFLVMGGITIVSGALFAGWMSFVFSWVTTAWTGGLIVAFNRLGPGGLASAVSQNPNGIAGKMADDMAPLVPWRGDARAAKRTASRASGGIDPIRLGLDDEFSAGELRRIDDRLGVPLELRGTGAG